jgi:DNA-binding response OmpR family regulator
MPPRPPRLRRLLVVEDELQAALAIQKVFRRRGWEVQVATTVAGGLALLELSRFDWVILDLMLPDGGGERILAHVRARGLGVRVCVSSGCSDEVRMGEVRALEPEAVLSKPLEVPALLDRLDGPDDPAA